jgi:hypothetical protein
MKRYPIHEGNAPTEDFHIDTRLRARIAASEHNVSSMFEKFYEAAAGKDVAKGTEILIKISQTEILTAKHLLELIVMIKKLAEAEIDHVDIVRLLDGVRKNFVRIYGPN